MKINKKKKIGIVTFFQNNYGSALQCFATAFMVAKNGFYVEILSCKHNTFIRKVIKLFILIFSKKQRDFFFKNKNNKKTYNALDDLSRYEINHFFDNYYEVLDLTKNELKHAALANEYAGFIVGSDQVWNLTWPDIDGFWFLDFCPNDKKVAFAVSCGTSDVNDYNIKYFKLIKKFKSVSVREYNSKLVFEQHYKGEVEVVCDPTIMLSKEVWSDIFDLEIEEDNYIFIHFLDELTSSTLSIIKNASLELGLPIVSVGYNQPSFSEFNNIKFIKGGPKVFLNYLSKSKLIFTDSFHTTIFSINFKKNFYVFERNYKFEHKQNLRIMDLLSRFELKDRLISGKDKIDYSYPQFKDKLLEEERNKTKNYLLNALRRLNHD